MWYPIVTVPDSGPSYSVMVCVATNALLSPFPRHKCCGSQLCDRSCVHSPIPDFASRWNGSRWLSRPPGHAWLNAPKLPAGWSSNPRTPGYVP